MANKKQHKRYIIDFVKSFKLKTFLQFLNSRTLLCSIKNIIRKKNEIKISQ
jgi:hypothetical protein